MNRALLVIDLVMIIEWLCATYIEHLMAVAPDAPEWER